MTKILKKQILWVSFVVGAVFWMPLQKSWAVESNYVRDRDSIPADKSKAISLPDPKIIELPNVSNVLDYVKVMGVSEGFRASSNESSSRYQVFQGVDLVAFETSMARDFLTARGRFAVDTDPVSNKGIIILRYGVEHPLALQLFRDAKDLGAHSTVLISDGPLSLNEKLVKFGTHEYRGETRENDFSNDITPEKLSQTGQGMLIKNILDSEYKLYSPVLPKDQIDVQSGDFFVALSAAANPAKERKPIMHMKEALFYVLKDNQRGVTPDNIKKMYILSGTANWTHAHVNRTFLFEDKMENPRGPGLVALEHAMAVLSTFTQKDKSAEISDIVSIGRNRFVAADGSFFETAYTDGQLELNYRIVTFFNEVANHPENYDIKEVILSHFVMTNKNVVDAIYAAWNNLDAVGRPFKVRGVVDAKFVGPRSFGVSSLLAEYDVRTDFGQIRHAYPKKFAKHVSLVMDLEEIPGAVDINPEGPPRDRVLWHDKTTVVRWQNLNNGGAAGPEWAEVFTGSYNNSNNKDNLERQDHFHVAANSGFVTTIVDSILQIGSEKMRQKKAVPLHQGVFLKTLAEYVGQSPMDLDWEVANSVLTRLERLALLSRSDRERLMIQVGETLKKMASHPSRLAEGFRVSQDEMDLRMATLHKFGTAYSDLPEFRQGLDNQLSANELLSVALGATENARSAKYALMQVLWSPEIPEHILEARAYKLFSFMDLEKLFLKKGLKPEDSSFRFSPEISFGANTLSAIQVNQFIQELAADKLAKTTHAILQATLLHNPDKQSIVADELEVARRLSTFVKMSQWYQTIEFTRRSPRNVSLSPRELATQLISENLDLLLLKTQPQDLLVKTIEYSLSLKGYSFAMKEQRSQLVTSALNILNEGLPQGQTEPPGSFKPSLIGAQCESIVPKK